MLMQLDNYCSDFSSHKGIKFLLFPQPQRDLVSLKYFLVFLFF